MEKEAKCKFVFKKEIPSSMISGFCRVVAEICVLLGYYAASSSKNFSKIKTYQGN
jgi:D-aminopeptidase